jgi:hypothetical protein
MLDPASDYFESSTHDYLEVSYDELADYIFYKLDLPGTCQSKEAAIELGPGSGRFTKPVIDNFNKIILIEPSQYFCKILHEKYSINKIPGKDITVFNESLESYFDISRKNACTDHRNIYIFGFHLLHHLNDSEKESLYSFIRESGSFCLLVDPYYLNPLILIQILITPEMKFKEEYRYLKINKRSLKKELKEYNLSLLSYERIVPLAPFFIQKLLLKKRMRTISFLELLGRFIPFIYSYHAYLIAPVHHEHN